MRSQILDVSSEEVEPVFPCGARRPQQDPGLASSFLTAACRRIKVQLQIMQKKREIFCFNIICACVRTFLLTWEALLIRNRTTAS